MATIVLPPCNRVRRMREQIGDIQRVQAAADLIQYEQGIVQPVGEQ